MDNTSLTVGIQLCFQISPALCGRGLSGILRAALCLIYNVPVLVIPSPENPSWHVQLWDPRVFSHTSLTSQLCVPSVHSSISNTIKKIPVEYLYRSGNCY